MLKLKERLAKQREELKSRGGDFRTFLIKEGTTRFRLLPAGEEKDWAIEAVVFYLGKDLGFVISPATFNEKCAIMKAHKQLSDSKKEADRETAKTFRPTKRFYAPAIRYLDIKGKEIDKENGVKLLTITGGTYQELINLYLDADEAGDFTDKVDGYDIKFGRTGKTKTDTEYTTLACKPTPLSKLYAKKVYDPAAMIREIMPTYEETKTMVEKFLSLAPDDDADDAPKKSTKKKKKVRRDL